MAKKFLFFLIFLSFSFLHSQEADSLEVQKEMQYDENSELLPLELDDSQIEDYRNQKDFNYIETVENDSWWTRFKKWLNAKYNQFINWLFGDYEANSILAAFIAVLPYLLILAIIALVVWLFSKLNPGGKILREQKTSEVFLSEEEDLVKNEDLLSLMKEAIQNGNFRLAVRYYYLLQLRKLDDLEIIQYEYQKTNRDYLMEIRDQKIKDQFSNISKLYEFIWYGSFQVSETDYRLAEKGFVQMEDSLKNLRYE
ncbi:DUF4129 domain-containing protein [Christiangramia sp. SM2212]|uniref:DUF4129 domain-containing protein n=1 Tax=Christiangramia sediminicola TaxID=3073267 RepID=A0ABU1ENL5_9FLAO|nr:DUF4129 domain-containing protein [Christiangramia sp. SM2212]MDR5589984.1 DUF4129 domain-containing protein [Christiangramia sp. SM2212]